MEAASKVSSGLEIKDVVCARIVQSVEKGEQTFLDCGSSYDIVRVP